MEPLAYDDLSLQEIPVTLKGQTFVLREGDSKAQATYKNAEGKTLTNRDGTLGITDGAGDLDPLIVHLSLFQVYEKHGQPTKGPVARSFVDGLPGWIITDMARKCRELWRIIPKKSKADLEKQIAELTKQLEAIGEDSPEKKPL